MRKNLLMLISGSSGVGKNTVINELIKKDEDSLLLRSSTTRPKRVDDKIQKDGEYAYYFLSKEEFENKIASNEMLEYDIFSGNYYGISNGSINNALSKTKYVLKDITVKGMVNCKALLDNNINIVTVFLTLNKSMLKKRLILRQTKDIKARLKNYKFEQKNIKLYDYCINNIDLNTTLKYFEAIKKFEIDNKYLHLAENIKNFNYKKVDVLCNKLQSNKKVPKVMVTEKDGVIYIVKGLNTYLASIKTNITTTKYFIDKDFEIKSNQNDWMDIVKQFI